MPEPFTTVAKATAENDKEEGEEDIKVAAAPPTRKSLPYRFRMPEKRKVDPVEDDCLDIVSRPSLTNNTPLNPLKERAWKKIPVSKQENEGDFIAELTN